MTLSSSASSSSSAASSVPPSSTPSSSAAPAHGNAVTGNAVSGDVMPDSATTAGSEALGESVATPATTSTPEDTAASGDLSTGAVRDSALPGVPAGAEEDLPDRAAGNTRPLWKTIGRALLIVVLVWVVYSGIRLGLYGYAAMQEARALLTVYRAHGLDRGAGEMVVRAYPHILELQRIGGAVHGTVRVVNPLFRGLSVLPWVGETAGAVPVLLDAGRGLMDVGVGAATLLVQTGQVNPDAGLVDLATQTFHEQTEGFAVLAARAAELRAQVEGIDSTRLLNVTVEPVEGIQATVRLLEAGLQVTPALPGLLGAEGPRTYLLLMQNNHELRPTGGFISAIGSLTLADGGLGDLQIEDSYRIANNNVDHPLAPEAMQKYMGIDLIFVRDANWSPDFPTTAALVQALYSQDTGKPVHGVVALDLHAVQMLVDSLGPVAIEGTDAVVTGDNFVEQIIQFWEQPLETGDTLESAGLGQWWRQRKDFMPALAQSGLAKLRSGRVNPLAVARATIGALDNGSIQVWLSAPGVNSYLAEWGWAGEVAAPAGSDFLAVVDTNMGYNKVDAVLARAVSYAVEWVDGRGVATAEIVYHHPTPVPGHVCDPEPRYGENYADMTERCYFNFVRLYVPRGSELRDVAGVESDSLALHSQTGPNNTQVFGGYFIMQPGSRHVVRFTYALPPEITPENYRLTVRRQSGTNPLPLEINAGTATLATTVEDARFVWQPSLPNP